MIELFFFLVIAFNGDVSRIDGFGSYAACESYRAKVVLKKGSETVPCEGRSSLVKWWYLMVQPEQPWDTWTPIAGQPTGDKCMREREAYLLYSPRSVPTCVAVPEKVEWIERLLNPSIKFMGELKLEVVK